MSDKTPSDAPALLWFRRDLRLADNPALQVAATSGRQIIPVFLLDETDGVRFPGAAGLWWLDRSLQALGGDLEKLGSKLVLRRGEAGKLIRQLIEETGATAVYWNRLYDPGQCDRDASLKTALKADGIEVRSCNGALLVEPWEIQNKTGGYYQVFTPFWRAARQLVGDFPIHAAPKGLKVPKRWPASDQLESWSLHPTKPDWSSGFDVWTPGEAGAQNRLHALIDGKLSDYPTQRDIPETEGTSRLSPHLHWGEIGPRQIWRAIESAAHRHPKLETAAQKFLTELGWREFNHHLLFQRPDLPDHNFKAAYEDFPWRTDKVGFTAWAKGRTGYPMVDAGMRELWTTGYMENRVRMITASFLIKHLLLDWRQGERWFWDTLLDASPANNVLNWQWVAGSGADASPFFRIFNPIGQGEKFDTEGGYIRRWIPELAKLPAKYIHAPWTAPLEVLTKAEIKLGDTYSQPIVDHDIARQRALAALKTLRKSPDDTDDD